MSSVVIGDYEYTVIGATSVSVRVIDTSKQSYENIRISVKIDGKSYVTTSLERCFSNCVNMVVAPDIFLGPFARNVNMNQCFEECVELTSINRIPDYTTTMEGCFANCSSLSQIPSIPETVINMSNCFYGCISLSEAPVIPSSVTNMTGTFRNCMSLLEAPVIPSSVKEMTNCFNRCVSLQGIVVAYNDPLVKNNQYIFSDTKKTIFIVDRNPEPKTNIWKREAETFQNVHYEADDNPLPVVSNFTATRVSTTGSTEFEPTGLYAYLQAKIMVYNTLIPDGWTNGVKNIILKDGGIEKSATWQPTMVDYPVDAYCWIYLGDTSTHNLSLQIADSIKEGGVEIKSKLSGILNTNISKSYALIDYYHDEATDTEGVAIGKYAEHADLLDIDMPTLFRQGLSLTDGEFVARTILDYIWPVGSAYSTTDSTFNPNNVWGGTWVSLPEGYVLLSGSESGSYIVGDDISTSSGYKEYGSNTHTLLEDEIPAHAHGLNNHTHSVQRALGVSGTGTWTGEQGGALSGSTGKYAYTQVSGTTIQTITATGGNSNNTTSKGGGKAHSIMQKSIAVYWWIRTA